MKCMHIHADFEHVVLLSLGLLEGLFVHSSKVCSERCPFSLGYERHLKL